MSDEKTLATVKPGGCVQLGQEQRSDLVPGIVRCAKCAFQLHRTNLYLQSGTIGAGDSKTEPCPNGCGPLWPVTWETWAREGWAEAERLHLKNAALAARQTVGEPAAIPEGWALVDLAEYTVLPQIPTTAMMDAGWPIGEQITDRFDVKGAYADLIAEHDAKGEGIIHGPSQPPAQADQEYLESLYRALEGVIDERDRYHEMADDLAGHIAAITGVDIGEHSSANCPWQNAIEAAEAYQPAQAVGLGAVRALLQRRIEQWRSHLPADPGAPGTREIETKGEHDYNNDVRIYREGIAVMEDVLALIDSQAVGNG